MVVKMKQFARSPIFLSLILSTALIAGCRQEAGYSANFPAMGLPTPSVAPGAGFAALPPADFVSVQEMELAADDTIDAELLEDIPGAPPRDTAVTAAAEVPAAPAPAPVAAPTPVAEAAPVAAPAPAPQAVSVDVNMDVLATYARATGNNLGEKIYRRLQISREAARAACAQFTNADEAQSMLLFRGGPAEDPLNLDPDGDGFACGWSPVPFRN